MDIENTDSDLEHIALKDLSKFPNIRSIPTELILKQNLNGNSNKNDEKMELVPIKIIIRAPHLDIYEDSVIKHDYLILNTSDPDIHDHLYPGIKFVHSKEIFDFEEGSADFESNDQLSNIWKIEHHDISNQKENEIKIVSENNTDNNNNYTRNGWYGYNIKIDENVNKESKEIKKTIFGKDESPGLFGEVADYWRNDGLENFYNETLVDGQDDEVSHFQF